MTTTTRPAPVNEPDLDRLLVPPGTAPHPYRPLALRAGLLQGAIVAAVVVELASFLVIRRALAGHLAAGALDSGRWVLAAAVLGTLPFLALWAHRAARNLEPLGARGVPFPTSMAAWSWFVPIVNLGLPLTVLRSTARASDPEYASGTEDWKRLPGRRLVVAFWIAHLLDFGLGLVIRGTATSVHSWWLSGAGLATVLACDVATCALGIAMVRRISDDQRHRATRLARRGVLPERFQDHGAT